MLSLQDREWAVFTVEDLFEVSRPQTRSKEQYVDGDVPFIASGAKDNGVARYCEPRPGEYLDKAGCITVSPVDGSAFYQPVDFLGRGGGGSSIILLRSVMLNRYNSIFISRMLSHTLSAKYTYGRMGNGRTILGERMLLPVDGDGEPDWQFMESYIREREAIHVRRCYDFLKTRLDELERERE